MKQSFQDRIKAFHDGTAVVERALDIVPRALAEDAALFQKDRDQIDWFRQMEAIEVQELALRFQHEPEGAALWCTDSPELKQEILPAPKEIPAPEQDYVSSIPDGQEIAEEPPSADDEVGPDLDADLAASALPLGEDEDPQAFATWLRHISSESSTPHSISSNEFARWAVEERYRARVSRNTVVKTLMALRRVGASGSASTVTELATSWSQLEGQVLRHNIRAALHWANRHGGTLPDGLAFVFGLAGMRRAVRAFEPARGWKFLTFASWWMRQCVRRARVDYGTALRIPVHLDEKLSLLKRATGGYSHSVAQDLSNTQILTAVGKLSDRIWSYDELERVRHLDRRQRVSDVSDPTEPVLAVDYLFDESRWMPTEVATDESHRASLAIAADALIEAIEHQLSKKPREEVRSRVVIYERLGLDGQRRRPTLEQLGQRYQVTRERIRQLEAKGFAGICKTLGIAAETHDD